MALIRYGFPKEVWFHARLQIFGRSSAGLHHRFGLHSRAQRHRFRRLGPVLHYWSRCFGIWRQLHVLRELPDQDVGS